MTDTPQAPGDPGQTPWPPTADPAAAPPAPVPAVPPPANPNAGVSAGAAAPNSEMAPGRGLPLVGGAPNSARGPISATGLNVGFLLAGVVGFVLIVILVLTLIHAIFH